MDFDSYKRWIATCSCVDCGAKYSDRARDFSGVALDTWVTETQCLACWKKLGAPEHRGLPGSRDLAARAGLEAER